MSTEAKPATDITQSPTTDGLNPRDAARLASTIGASVPITVDLANHTIIPIARVPEFFSRTMHGKKISKAAVYRWMQKSGMPYLQLPSGRVTSVEALQLWAERRTHRAPTAPVQISLGRQQAIERAAKEARSLLSPSRSRHVPPRPSTGPVTQVSGDK